MAEVELVAVSSIKLLLAKCGRLVPDISDNDKTPITDGHVDLYEGLGRKKTEITGRMPVQVKGRTIGSKRRASTKFPIPRADVVALRRHGSVLYFVVFVDARQRTVPYYVIMSPFYIDSLLQKAPADANQVIVDLKALPSEPARLERIVAMALETRKQQYAAFSGEDFESVTSMTLHSIEPFEFTTPLRVSAEEWSYAIDVETADGYSLPLIGEVTIYPAAYVAREADLRVECGGIEYLHLRVQQVSEDTHRLTLSPGLQIQLQLAKGSRSSSVNLTLAPDLATRLKDIEFFLNLVDLQSVTYGTTVYPFDLTSSPDVDDLRDYREHLRLLHELFVTLHVETSLVRVDEMDDKQHNQLRLIHGAFLQGEELRANDARVGRTDVPVGTAKLMLLAVQGSTPDRWRLLDPFDPAQRHNFKLYRETDDGVSEWQATVYDGVPTNDVPTILNLRLDELTRAYDAIAGDPEVTTLANGQVLSLIIAADQSRQRRDEFLAAANALNEWILAREGELPTHLINRWQIRSRTGELSSDAKDEIRDLRRKALVDGLERAPQMEVACAILLGDAEDIDNCLRGLSADEREQLRRWPIWTLHARAALEGLE
ncbi:hypothetical protein [Agromyces sp. NPDC058104]|uniref:hypothetical protein n=1 Tax=Agromyces sp. NPDC058104 TaxID=3346342 RepID=UPI0036DDE97F